MKRTLFPCLIVFSVLSMVLSHGAPPPEAPPGGQWTIEDPHISIPDNTLPLYLANIGCDGLAPDGTLGFTLDVFKLDNVGDIIPGAVNSVGGTSTNGSWGATIPEPTGGWTANNVAEQARIVLTSGGMEEETVDIEIQ